MGTCINPCRGCPLRDGCALRAEWRQKVCGLGLRNAWFVCPTLAKEIRPGRRIQVTIPVMGIGYDYRGGEHECFGGRKMVRATITTADARNHTFACVVDPGQISEEEQFSNSKTIDEIRFLKRRHHWRIVQFLDEPDLPLCKLGNVLRDGKCDTSDGSCSCREWAAADELTRSLSTESA